MATRNAQNGTDWPRQNLRLANGLRVSVIERPSTQPTSQPTILILHGLVAEAAAYTKLMAAFPPDRRVLALDLPGAGYSKRPALGCCTFEDLAASVADAITQLELHQPLLLGHSHGGAVALRLAADRPEFLSGLLLMAPAHPYAHNERPVIRFYLSPPGRLFSHLLPHIPAPLMLFGFRHMPGARRGVTMADIQPYLHTLRAPGTIPHILRIVEAWNNDMRALQRVLEAQPINLPTLLLWGDRDLVVPIHTAARLAAHLPHAWSRTIPGIGHVPQEEVPDQAAMLMANWLNDRNL